MSASDPDFVPCDEQKVEEEFALVNAATPVGTAFILVAVAHDHGMHVMVENNLPSSALAALFESVLDQEIAT